jgi:carbon storage regulator
MLVINRRKNEGLVINDEIILTVMEIRGDKVRLGIVSPRGVSVHRQEIYEAIDAVRPRHPSRPPEETPFLRAIEERPDDEAVRLIFADWLEERGDPLAELLRIQCQLAQLPPGDRRRKPLARREIVVWGRHGDAWTATLPPALWSVPSTAG